MKTTFVYCFISDVTSSNLTEENQSFDSQNISTIEDNNSLMDDEESTRNSEHHESDNINSVDIFLESMFELFLNNLIDRT
jgi:hypothetical protein